MKARINSNKPSKSHVINLPRKLYLPLFYNSVVCVCFKVICLLTQSITNTPFFITWHTIHILFLCHTLFLCFSFLFNMVSLSYITLFELEMCNGPAGPRAGPGRAGQGQLLRPVARPCLKRTEKPSQMKVKHNNRNLCKNYPKINFFINKNFKYFFVGFVLESSFY